MWLALWSFSLSLEEGTAAQNGWAACLRPPQLLSARPEVCPRCFRLKLGAVWRYLDAASFVTSRPQGRLQFLQPELRKQKSFKYSISFSPPLTFPSSGTRPSLLALQPGPWSSPVHTPH